MRIIAGEFRGRKIKQPDMRTTRPTKDRIREAVFNMIAEKVPGAAALDMFAGSGAYGLEALSRGAEKAVFIEEDGDCCGCIKDNIDALGVAERSEVIASEVFSAIELNVINTNIKFDIIFSDAPYNKGLAKKTLIKINQYDILNRLGLLVIEHHRDEILPRTEGDVTVYKEKTYGDTAISIFLKK